MAPVRVERPRVSYSDLQRQPEDGPRYELYDGEAFVIPAPVPRHQRVSRDLLFVLVLHTRSKGGEVLGTPIDVVFSEHDVVQPDLVVFGAARQHLIQAGEPIRHPPDIAVEILSPSTESTDRCRKMQLLARYGVPEYWLVDPREERVEIYWLNAGTYLLGHAASKGDDVRSMVLPELTFPAAEIFREWQT
jgi:Uma2 family endonuclease